MSDFLFLDLETTGLDPQRCHVIEVACVLTRDDFVPYAEFEAIVRPPPSSVWQQEALDMHKASGLERLTHSGISSYMVSVQLDEFLRTHLDGRRANLAGNSVHFDRGFLEHWPNVFCHLTHRHLDVSSLRLLGEALGLPKLESGEKPHRAMADVRHSLRELRYWTWHLQGKAPVCHVVESTPEGDVVAHSEGFMGLSEGGQ